MIIFIQLNIIFTYKKIKIFKTKRFIKSRRNSALIPIPKLFNDPLIKLEKQKLIEFISKSTKENITNIRQIYLLKKLKFGNQLIMISKAIFYCYILECKRIILIKGNNWFIKNKVIIKKYKIIVEPGNSKNIKNFDTLIDNTPNFFYYKNFIKPESSIPFIRKEIYKNLPKVLTNKNDLFIYIRSGDIFVKSHYLYAQPPLCFYSNVLDNFEFNRIFLITENKNNPVISELLKIYPFIIYSKNNLKMDISYLINAFNVAGGGFSTFFSNILSLNYNLKVLFNFQLRIKPPNIAKKISIQNFYICNKNTVFTMYSTKYYLIKMKPWKNTIEQRNLMLSSNCSKNFILNNELIKFPID